MLDGDPDSHNRPQEKMKYGSLLFTHPEGSTRHALRGHIGKVKAGCRQWERDRKMGPGAQDFIEVLWWSLLGSQAKVGQSNQNRRVWVSPTEVWPKRPYCQKALGAGEAVGHKCSWGSRNKNWHLLVTLPWLSKAQACMRSYCPG